MSKQISHYLNCTEMECSGFPYLSKKNLFRKINYCILISFEMKKVISKLICKLNNLY